MQESSIQLSVEWTNDQPLAGCQYTGRVFPSPEGLGRDVGGIVSGVLALDTQLTKTKDYFDATAHPTITFKSREVRSTGEKSGEMTGDLTINGVTKPVTMAVVWNFLGPHPLGAINPTYQDVTAAGFSARTQILRSEWGMTRTIPLVSDEIRIIIETEMHKVQ